MDVIEYYAGNHIGFFLTWIIQHQFEGELLKETANEDLQAVRNETMSGIEFFIKIVMENSQRKMSLKKFFRL